MYMCTNKMFKAIWFQNMGNLMLFSGAMFYAEYVRVKSLSSDWIEVKLWWAAGYPYSAYLSAKLNLMF